MTNSAGVALSTIDKRLHLQRFYFLENTEIEGAPRNCSNKMNIDLNEMHHIELWSYGKCAAHMKL